MITLVFFLEEFSAQSLLERLLPRLLPKEEFAFRFIPFEGKQDLEKQLVRKMRSWRNPNSRFIVLRDQDANDCKAVKAHLVKLCRKAGHPEALVRIACHELESWYLGDLRAVEKALPVGRLKHYQGSRKFRDPDHLANPSMELERLTEGKYQKVAGSRAIAPHLDLGMHNRSRSFRAFVSGVSAHANGQKK
ncbi:MAG: hypothetical protein DRH04_07395 [Deltaproteobacteria bacterium]|nr:MAG: hypothetical protein DRH04_07395 [Deltaproteobacteria bacterium]